MKEQLQHRHKKVSFNFRVNTLFDFNQLSEKL